MNHHLSVATVIFVSIILLIQGSWILNDSRKRGDSLYWLWGLLGFLSFPMPVIIYVLITRINQIKCKNCGNKIDKSSLACPYCGEKIKKSCPSCGLPVEDEWVYCPRCSGKL